MPVEGSGAAIRGDARSLSRVAPVARPRFGDHDGLLGRAGALWSARGQAQANLAFLAGRNCGRTHRWNRARINVARSAVGAGTLHPVRDGAWHTDPAGLVAHRGPDRLLLRSRRGLSDPGAQDRILDAVADHAAGRFVFPALLVA